MQSVKQQPPGLGPYSTGSTCQHQQKKEEEEIFIIDPYQHQTPSLEISEIVPRHSSRI